MARAGLFLTVESARAGSVLVLRPGWSLPRIAIAGKRPGLGGGAWPLTVAVVRRKFAAGERTRTGARAHAGGELATNTPCVAKSEKPLVRGAHNAASVNACAISVGAHPHLHWAF